MKLISCGGGVSVHPPHTAVSFPSPLEITHSHTCTHTLSHTHYRVSSHNKHASYCLPAGGVTLRPKSTSQLQSRSQISLCADLSDHIKQEFVLILAELCTLRHGPDKRLPAEL
ncbi:Ribosomal protein S12 methylthiotransferase RimO [Labeo rohita]|uniref:Ribosomal protein S12 methylthiotransferase RimO n=1 Tax=Labeo rohita TaxID=84645 RepID=A0ABQ8MN80_LABRO|nr:Ribosomal protein S12 methylthiotransferase RimO [Labeo rohita]